MAIRLSVLGSGSGGNATILILEEGEHRRYLLIDAGFSPKDLCGRLLHVGVYPEQIDGLLITHLHSDHLHEGWIEQCNKYQIPMYLHQQHVGLWAACSRSFQGVSVIDASLRWGSTHIQTIQLPHDQQGSVGYLIEHRGVRMGFVTDLGHVPAEVFDLFQCLDILAIESNYDRKLQQDSPRPAYLKRRIMSKTGHLSNDQAYKAICRIAAQSCLRHIVLLHRSEQCNTIPLIQGLYDQRHPHLLERMIFTDQHTPTAMLHVEAHTLSAPNSKHQQMDLFSL